MVFRVLQVGAMELVAAGARGLGIGLKACEMGLQRSWRYPKHRKICEAGNAKALAQRRLLPTDDRLNAYIVAHSREPDVLRELREETMKMAGARMQVSPDQAQFMALLVQLMGAEQCIEVGVFTGYSSLAVAMALPDSGRLVACDRSESSLAIARKYYERAGVAHKVDVRCGLALDTLNRLILHGDASRYDFAFLDADKQAYPKYYELLLQLLRPGGLLVIDNVLWHGAVVNPLDDDKRTQCIRNLNDFLLVDDRVNLSMITVGDGMALCHKR